MVRGCAFKVLRFLRTANNSRPGTARIWFEFLALITRFAKLQKKVTYIEKILTMFTL